MPGALPLPAPASHAAGSLEGQHAATLEDHARPRGGRYTPRPIAPAITRTWRISSSNSEGVSDCWPSESAFSG
jgi:hypothetical protein